MESEWKQNLNPDRFDLSEPLPVRLGLGRVGRLAEHLIGIAEVGAQ